LTLGNQVKETRTNNNIKYTCKKPINDENNKVRGLVIKFFLLTLHKKNTEKYTKLHAFFHIFMGE
jgi:hypothetical protein